jgi:polyhydroxyalkanoate synthase
LRNCYLDNNLSKGAMQVAGVTLDLHKVKVPIYNMAAREDHIAPAQSVLYGSQFFGGPVTFVLAGSGHIAGVVNPPALQKYQYWTGPAPQGSDIDAWVSSAKEQARAVGDGELKPIEDAPGSYVKVRNWD